MLVIRSAAGAAAVSVLALLAGCDQPKSRSPSSTEGLPPAVVDPGKRLAPLAPPAAHALKTSEAPAPAAPGWAAGLMGKPLRQAFPRGDGRCIGNTDVIEVRYTGAPAGVMIEGWGWDQAAGKVVSRIILTDHASQIVGAGETGVPRPDVVAARKEVASPTSGWTAVTRVTEGLILAYGVVGDGATTCVLGRLQL
jgi:hypothetical protein